MKARRRTRIALTVLASVAFTAAALFVRAAVARHAPSSAATRATDASAEAGGYDAAVGDLAKRRKLAEVLADAAPGSWTRRAQAASYELGYAQLTGDYDAYEAADRAVAEAFRVARRGIDDDAVGPHLLKAQLDYELHRLEPALESLRAPEAEATFFHDAKLLAEIASIRGAVTFALGQYEDGLSLLRDSIDLDPTAGHKQRLALALAKVGDFDETSRIFDETETASAAPRSRAWLALQRGLIDLQRGRRDQARRRFAEARALFPGFWQTEEHLAEIDAAEGRTAEAIAAYRALIDKTGDPEFMDALARLIAEREPAEASRLVERSSAIYEQRLAKLPEASYGHALEHFLKMVPNAARAVDVAEKNCRLRPNGEARTRLAQAYVRAGRLREAEAMIRTVVESSWVSAESYATAAIVARLLGDESAEPMRAKALGMNRYALEELDWLKPI